MPLNVEERRQAALQLRDNAWLQEIIQNERNSAVQGMFIAQEEAVWRRNQAILGFIAGLEQAIQNALEAPEEGEEGKDGAAAA